MSERSRVKFSNEVTYFITFACYGAHLHGDGTGSVDREHNMPGSPLLDEERLRETREQRSMQHAAQVLNDAERAIVLKAILEVACHREWSVIAAHVRTNHVHVGVDAPDRPEKVMNDFKAYSSRALNRVGPGGKRWARHGSTRWLSTQEDIRGAVRYVVEEQGAPMALFVGEVR